MSGSSGIFVTPAKINCASDALEEKYFQAPEMDGVAIRLQWYALEPSQGVYDWTLIDGMIDNAVKYNKALSLVVVGASQSPDWVKALSGPLQFEIMSPVSKLVTLPTPWSDGYLNAYLAMNQALHDHLVSKNALANVTLVKLAVFSSDSAELNLPRSDDLSINAVQTWLDAGYTSAKIIQSYGAFAQGLAAIFPGKNLGQVVMDGRSFPNIDATGILCKKSDVDTSDQIIKANPGLLYVANGLCHNMAATPVSTRLDYARSLGAATGWQTTHSGSDANLCASCADDDRVDAVKCTTDLYRAALVAAVKAGARYFEVWKSDFDEFRKVMAGIRNRLNR